MVSDCVCSGYNVTYECTTIGPGSTVWVLGNSSECEILLRHSQFASHTAVGQCMSGAVVGRGLQAAGSIYISQFSVLVGTHLDGRTVQCKYDDGASQTVIGTNTLTLTRQGE